MIALSPDHRADLQRSGLTADTITACRFEAVPPKELPMKGAMSAYRIPYFNLDGSVNGFHRKKFVPELILPDGKKVKYWQPRGSLPHLYLPPIVDWSTVSSSILAILEGEKKAAKACQEGLRAVGVGGVWNGSATLDTGDTLLLPAFDDVLRPSMTIELCPDSDAWHPGREHDILAGFFSLGKIFQSRGFDVRLVRLPDVHGVKSGPDDWLMIPGNDVAHAWPKLERIALDDDRLDLVNAQWQRRQEKKTTLRALKQHELDDLALIEAAGLYTVRSAGHNVTLCFDRLADVRGGVSAELSVRLGATALLSGIDVGLKSDTGQTKLAGSLKALASALPWKLLLQRACSLVLARHREGEPIIVLQANDAVQVPFVIAPFVYEDHPSLIYAPGGSLKSYLALYLALLACHGQRQNGLSAQQVPVLYLDWELNAATVGGRLKALQSGHPELAQFVPFYRRCEYPLHQEVHQIAKFVAEHGVRLIVLDSAVMACGGELNSPDTVVKLTKALRIIGCASLLLAHVSKLTPEGQERSAFGSVYFRELARNVWELEKAEVDGPPTLLLKQTKDNFNPYHAPMAFRFTFSNTQVQVTACDPAEEPQFAPKLPMASQIRNLLEDGTPRTYQQIAKELDRNEKSVKSCLSKSFNRDKWCNNLDGLWTVLKGRKGS